MWKLPVRPILPLENLLCWRIPLPCFLLGLIFLSPPVVLRGHHAAILSTELAEFLVRNFWIVCFLVSLLLVELRVLRGWEGCLSRRSWWTCQASRRRDSTRWGLTRRAGPVERCQPALLLICHFPYVSWLVFSPKAGMGRCMVQSLEESPAEILKYVWISAKSQIKNIFKSPKILKKNIIKRRKKKYY